MGNAVETWLASYVRAWERHQIHFSLCPPLCIDADRFLRLSGQAEKLPAGLSPAVVVSGGPLTYRFSYGHHDRSKRGERNGHFLDPGMLQDVLLPAMEALTPRPQLVMLCLAPIYATEGLSVHAFLEMLDPFLSGLPRSYRFAVGVRNPNFLLPEYCACLRSHGMAHLFDETAMPPLLDQIQIPGILTAEHAVYRNTPGPWPGQSMDGGWELGMVETIRRCVVEKKTCFLYLDEHAGAASLETLMTMLNADLARLSPIRKQAA
ncbi:MAG: hypothetical protein H6Q30_1483 [Bacteroidetes bacterium]|nr:hypothetical protein [Bacteroidota bacterium]